MGQDSASTRCILTKSEVGQRVCFVCTIKIVQVQVDWPSLEPPRSIWSGFGQKIAIFGALDAWIGAWNWQKWPQAILSHQLGCDMAHQALSRWTGLAWSHPGLFGPDLAKK